MFNFGSHILLKYSLVKCGIFHFRQHYLAFFDKGCFLENLNHASYIALADLLKPFDSGLDKTYMKIFFTLWYVDYVHTKITCFVLFFLENDV